MLARFDYKVRQLTRVRFGPLTLEGVGSGKYRELTPDEVQALGRAAENAGKKPAARKTDRSKTAEKHKGAATAKAAPVAEKEFVETAEKLQPNRELSKRRRVHDFTK